MKRRVFLVCLFYCFFRLPIDESIAAIFWQSAIYVFRSVLKLHFINCSQTKFLAITLVMVVFYHETIRLRIFQMTFFA